MSDPLAEMVTLLQPSAGLSKAVSGGGVWSVIRDGPGNPFYCVMLEGASRLAVEAEAPVELRAGDFVLVPGMCNFTMSGSGETLDETLDPRTVTRLPGEIRHGDPDAPANARLLVGHFSFGSPDAELLLSLLPRFFHVRGDERLSALVGLVTDEARNERPAREIILARLLEVLLLETLRSTSGETVRYGILRGLGDERLAPVIRLLHEHPTREWTMEQLAGEAALSRSAFFKRFRRAMGVAPMEYLISWRMALARNLLMKGNIGIQEIAERVGYRSASAFSTAFTRFVGLPPSRYAASGAAP
ncbi:AraC family transcriptional regulator [Ciceribacter sp. T2.26MG-112.2]|uniref:AraC family transcriptional regulator n=1 Tax=Ciceribacter sp. T2.26MG-112.2 TaxID=3137154 RepID=UPI0012B6ABA1|nr:AraC family transcriptional regulator [Ciceribacter naphthalenivorans]